MCVQADADGHGQRERGVDREVGEEAALTALTLMPLQLLEEVPKPSSLTF